MSKRRSEREITVSEGEGVVVLRRDGERDVRVAQLLGVLHDVHGRRVLYLDRLVHSGECRFAGFDASGALTTILTQSRE